MLKNNTCSLSLYAGTLKQRWPTSWMILEQNGLAIILTLGTSSPHLYGLEKNALADVMENSVQSRGTQSYLHFSVRLTLSLESRGPSRNLHKILLNMLHVCLPVEALLYVIV